MLALGLSLALLAWLLIWSGITGANPLDEIRSAFGPSGPGASPAK